METNDTSKPVSKFVELFLNATPSDHKTQDVSIACARMPVGVKSAKTLLSHALLLVGSQYSLSLSLSATQSLFAIENFKSSPFSQSLQK